LNTDQQNLPTGFNQLAAEKNYWLAKLSGSIAVSGVPADFLSNRSQPEWSLKKNFRFPEAIYRSLSEIAGGSELGLYILLLAGVNFLLAKYNGNEDIVVGMPGFKQDAAAGCPDNFAVLRSRVAADFCFKELLAEVKRTVVEADQNQNYPITKVFEQLGMEISAGMVPLFNTVVLLDNIHDYRTIVQIKADCVLTFSLPDGVLKLEIAYNGRLYHESTISRVFNHLVMFFDNLKAKVDWKLDQFTLLDRAERDRLLFEFNDTKAEYPADRPWQRLFEARAAQIPDRIALVWAGNQLTYGELNRKANCVARALLNRGVKPNDIVALMVTQSLEMVIGILGIFKAGGTYLPLNPDYPEKRIRYMLQDSKAGILLTQKRFGEGRDLEIGTIDLEDDALYEADALNPAGIYRRSSDTAYVVYTSGTTGLPKGVLLKQQGLVNYASWFAGQAGLTADDRTMLLSSYCFDLGYTSIFPSLLSGCQLHLAPAEVYSDPELLLNYIEDFEITYLKLTPSLLNVIVNSYYFTVFERDLSLRLVVLGGEAINPGDVAKLHRKYPAIRVMNHYGPTETTIGASTHMIDFTQFETFRKVPVIGKPIANTRIFILDSQLNPVPIGVPGEIHIAGAGLAKGYLNRPQLDAEKFVAAVLGGTPERLYRTGDRGRFDRDGNIEFLGRMDNQVKIKGFRVELGEIEAQLLQLSGVKEAAVAVKEDESGYKSLCAYLITERELNATTLIAELSPSLPAYMIPAHFIKLEQMPLTANGKLNRKALPDPVEGLTDPDYTAPSSPVEAKLASIITDVLTVKPEQVGVTYNLFNLGLDSIKSLRVISAVSKRMGTNISLSALYQNPTIRSLARHMDSGGEINGGNQAAIAAKIRKLKDEVLNHSRWGAGRAACLEDIYPLSDIEHGMVFFSLKYPEKGLYHNQSCFRLREPDFDAAVFQRALELLVEKHAILRTNFWLDEFEQPLQLVYRKVQVDLRQQDLSGLSSGEQHDYLQQYLRKDRLTPFLLTGAPEQPLWRAGLFNLGGLETAFCWSFHHAILDGWSVAIFITELLDTYSHLKQNPDFVLTMMRHSYRDFVLEQLARGENFKIAQYWKTELLDYKRLNLGTSPKGQAVREEQYLTLKQQDEALPVAKYRQIAEACGTDLKTLCFAAYAVTLSMLSYENDLVLGLLEHNRPLCEDSEKILGCFLNTLPVRVQIHPDMTWKDFLSAVAVKLIGLKTYGRLSLLEIAKLTGEAGNQGNPFFDTFFNYVDFNEVDSEMEVRPMFGLEISHRKNTLLDFSVSATFKYLEIDISYVRPLVSDHLAANLSGYFSKALQQLAAHPAGLIAKTPLLSDRERRQLLEHFNHTDAAYPSKLTLHQVFERQVAGTPGRIAVVFQEQSLTYRELNSRSNSVAKVLRDQGVRPDSIVAIMARRAPTLMIGILGILKAGGAYLPIDPDYPDERVAYMLRDSGATILLTQNNLLGQVKFTGTVIDLDRAGLYQADAPNPENVNTSRDLAYVIYTSGSTGQPKGTMIEHYSVLNRINWMQKQYPIGEADVILQKTAVTFDVSVWELFWWAFAGAKLCLLNPDDEKDPLEITAAVHREKVTTIHFVPSMLSLFLEHLETPDDCDKLASLRQVFASGEALHPHQVNLFNSTLNARYGTKLINLYGPTEATVDVSYFDCSCGGARLDLVPIGRPIDNIRLYILDRQGNLPPVGVAGELWIAGDGLARGYLNRPELTAERFITNPFVAGDRMYRTGDLARWLPDGNLEYLGRLDHQVKIRGFRVELGEIETRLLQLEGIKEAVAAATEDVNGSKSLCAYLVAEREMAVAEIRESLRSILPDYMVPSRIIRLEKLPLSANGKVDRKALPRPFNTRNDETPPAPPQNQTETRLCGIWSSILEMEGVGIDDNFFALGGHSLKATVLASRIRKEFGVDLALRQIFAEPTIRELARRVEQASRTVYPPLKPVAKREFYPLSASQRRMYVLCQLEGESINYNMPQAMIIEGELEVDRFGRAFQELVRRHETLRTSFGMVDGKLIQKIQPRVELAIEYQEAPTAGLDDLVRQFIRPFAFEQAPLLRVGLVKLAENRYLMLFDMHHIISDGVSMGIMIREFLSFYEGKNLAPLAFQYKDYAVWENRLFETSLYKRQEEYWLSTLAGRIPELRLPLDFPRNGRTDQRDAFDFEVNPDLVGAVKAMALKQKATIYMLLLSVYYVLLAKFTGQEDLIVGTGTSGRRLAELEGIIGMFVGVFAVRNRPIRQKTFAAFLAEVKESLIKLDENQDYSFDDFIKKLGLKREVGRVPLQDTMFILQNMEIPVLKLPKVNFIPYRYQVDASRNDLALYGSENEGRLSFHFEYCRNLFKKATIEKLARDYILILEQIIRDSQVFIGDLDHFNGTGPADPAGPFQDDGALNIEFEI
jgi:tyrocidine synthetase-3